LIRFESSGAQPCSVARCPCLSRARRAGPRSRVTGKTVNRSTATYMQLRWHLGTNFIYNGNDAAVHRMQNLFAGLRTGIVSWLAEVDYIVDDGAAGG
jgi:hypothetical protein